MIDDGAPGGVRLWWFPALGAGTAAAGAVAAAAGGGG